MSELRLHVEFSGGAELLVGKVKHHDITLPPRQPGPWSLRHLIAWIRDNLLKVNISAASIKTDSVHAFRWRAMLLFTPFVCCLGNLHIIYTVLLIE